MRITSKGGTPEEGHEKSSGRGYRTKKPLGVAHKEKKKTTVKKKHTGRSSQKEADPT